MSKSTMHLIPAVAYIRMSSDRQEASPEQQREEVQKLAKRHGMTIIREYFDEAISGADTKKRKQFLKMIADAQEGRFKAILCWDQDRFGRFDSIDAGEQIAPLRRAGVRLVTVTQGEINWNDYAGRIVYSVLQEGKNQFLVDLSRNCIRGKLDSIKRGVYQNGTPYGYDREIYDDKGVLVRRVPHGEKFQRPKGWTAKLVISEDKQAVDTIRWIFREYGENGASLHSIAAELAKRGVPTAKGGLWRFNTVRNFLLNRAYRGDMEHGKQTRGRFHKIGEDGTLTTANGTPDYNAANKSPIIIEGDHPALVDPALFDKVQNILQGRRETGEKPRANSDYPLSGILVCGHCGARLVGKLCTNRNNEYRYYICRNGGLEFGCKWYSVFADEIEGFLAGAMAEAASNPASMEMIEGHLRELVSAGDDVDEYQRLQRELAALDAKIKKATERMLLMDDDITEAQRMIGDWKREQRRLQQTFKGRAKTLDVKAVLAVALDGMEDLGQTIMEADKIHLKRIFDSHFEAITLYWNSCRVSDNRHVRRLSKGIIEVKKNGLSNLSEVGMTLSITNHLGHAFSSGKYYGKGSPEDIAEFIGSQNGNKGVKTVAVRDYLNSTYQVANYRIKRAVELGLVENVGPYKGWRAIA